MAAPNQCEARRGGRPGGRSSGRNFDGLIIVKLLPPVQSEFSSTHKRLTPTCTTFSPLSVAHDCLAGVPQGSERQRFSAYSNSGDRDLEGYADTLAIVGKFFDVTVTRRCKLLKILTIETQGALGWGQPAPRL